MTCEAFPGRTCIEDLRGLHNDKLRARVQQSPGVRPYKSQTAAKPVFLLEMMRGLRPFPVHVAPVSQASLYHQLQLKHGSDRLTRAPDS